MSLRPVKPRVNSAGAVELTIQDYENLSMNLQDILAALKQQQAVVKYYGSCLEMKR